MAPMASTREERPHPWQQGRSAPIRERCAQIGQEGDRLISGDLNLRIALILEAKLHNSAKMQNTISADETANLALAWGVSIATK